MPATPVAMVSKDRTSGVRSIFAGACSYPTTSTAFRSGVVKLKSL